MKINNELSRQYEVLKLKKEILDLENKIANLEFVKLRKFVALRWLWEKILFDDTKKKRWRKK